MKESNQQDGARNPGRSDVQEGFAGEWRARRMPEARRIADAMRMEPDDYRELYEDLGGEG